MGERLPSGETFCLGIQLHFEPPCISLHFRPGKLLCAKQCFYFVFGRKLCPIPTLLALV